MGMANKGGEMKRGKMKGSILFLSNVTLEFIFIFLFNLFCFERNYFRSNLMEALEKINVKCFNLTTSV